MPLWRCPHCGAPQPESARCWVCRRSTTCCATCRHFRRGVAAGLGYCGLDRSRLALRGEEMRECWEGAVTPGAGDDPPGTGTPLQAASGRPPWSAVARRPMRTFVPVDAPAGPDATASPAAVRRPPADDPPGATRWSLWSDLDA